MTRNLVRLALLAFLFLSTQPAFASVYTRLSPVAARESAISNLQSPCPSPYTVRSGDTLSRLARNCGTTVDALKAANGLTNDLIRVGQHLALPGVISQSPTPQGRSAVSNLQPSSPKIMVVVVDGWRYEDTYGDPTHQNIPHLWNDLRPQGVWHSRIYNLGVTLTAPGHAAILGGVWQPIPNDGTGRPTHPTIFEYYRKQTGAPANDTALIHNGPPDGKAGKWAYSTAVGYGEAYGAQQYFADGSDFDDTAVYNLALAALANHPRLALIAFPAVDEHGHNNSFQDYLAAIRTVDTLIWQLWNALQADPFYAGQTTLFITSDHCRRLDDFRTHGGDTESEQHVTLLTLGPRAPAGGREITTRRTLRDLAPTAGRIMGFTTPLAQGNVMWELVK